MADKHVHNVAVAKLEDGTVQLTFTIPWKDISEKREETAKELAKNIEIPGFRKGHAPLHKAIERLDPQYLIEKTLSQILPHLFAHSVTDNKLRPAMYPRFELLSAKDGEDWQVKATTAEIPGFDLGDYKKTIKDAAKKDSIWTPEKGDAKEALSAQAGKKELTQEQKESMAIKALEDEYKFTIPRILIEEEVNSRLSTLLERLERLGLSLESYLASIKKTAEELRNEYGEQAQNAIRLDVVLGKIAEKENIKVTEEEINAFMNVANSASKDKISEDQKSTVSVFLIKRKVLHTLASLIS